MNLLSSAKGIRARALALVACAALPIAAGVTVDQYASPYISYRSYVDFAANSIVAGHQNWSTFAAAEHPRGQQVKFYEIAVAADRQGGTLGACYEISTNAPVAGVTADTEILVKLPNNNVWQRLSDDHNGTMFSKARFYFGEDFVDPTTVFVRVAPYSNNTIHFNFYAGVVRTAAGGPITSEADCFADQTIAAAFVNRHEQVTIRRVR